MPGGVIGIGGLAGYNAATVGAGAYQQSLGAGAGLAGAIEAEFHGGLAAYWHSLGIGSGIARVTTPDQILRQRQELEKARLAALNEQASHYGRPIPQIWGKMRLAGNVIWASVPYAASIDPTVPAIWSPPDTTSLLPRAPGVGEVWRANVAVAICGGPMQSVPAIWADDFMIRGPDVPSYIADPTNAAAPNVYSITVYPGSETQAPDPTIEAALGAGNVPGYRGTCYVVIAGLDLTPYGGKVPNFSFVVHKTARGGSQIADVLADVAAQVGLASSDYDFSAATDYT